MRTAANHLPIAVALLFVALVYASSIDAYGMLMWDEAHYATVGRSLARGEGYVDYAGTPETFRPPLVPVAVALSILITGGDSDRVAKAPNLMFAMLCLIFVYHVVQRETDPWTATAATILMATFPNFWTAIPRVMTEIPFMLLYAAAIFFFYRGLYEDARAFFPAWICFALALLTRYTAVLYAPTLAVLLVWALWQRDPGVWQRIRSWPFFVAPLTALLLCGAWLGRTWYYTGNPFEGFVQASWQIPLYSAHGSQPATYYLTVLPQMIGWLPTVLLIYSLGWILGVRHRLGLHCLIAALVLIAWMTRYPWKEVRLISAILPFVAVIIGVGIRAAMDEFASKDGGGSRREVRLAALAAIVVASVALNYQPSAASLRGRVTLGYPVFRNAMTYLKQHSSDDQILLGPNCYQIHWYADRRCRMTPGDPKDFPTALASVDWFVGAPFERGQPKYVIDAMARFRSRGNADTRARLFKDRRYATVVIPAASMLPPAD